MAFNLFIRRATRSLVPLAARTFAVPTATIFQRTVTTLIGGHEESRGVRYIVPAASRRLSPETAKRHNILRAFFDSEPEGVDDGSPFKVVRVSPKERSVIYTRNYKGETIFVHYNELQSGDELENGDELESGDQLENDDKLEESDDQVENDDELESDDELENSKWCGCKLSMYVVKPNGWHLEFGSRIFKGEYTRDDLTLKNKESGEELVYDYNDLDENMQAAYMKFQRVRGLTNPAALGVAIFD